MDSHEVTQVIHHLQRLYGDRFPGLTLEMATLWLEALRPIPWPLAQQSMRRWAYEHTHHPPSLQQLLTMIEDIQAEQRRQRAATGQRAPSLEYGDRDDDYSTAEVRALLRSVWPDMFPPAYAPMKEEDHAARLEHLRQQMQAIVRDYGSEPLYEPQDKE